VLFHARTGFYRFLITLYSNLFYAHLQHFISCCVSVIKNVGRPQSGEKKDTHPSLILAAAAERGGNLAPNLLEQAQEGILLITAFHMCSPCFSLSQRTSLSYRMPYAFLTCNTNICK